MEARAARKAAEAAEQKALADRDRWKRETAQRIEECMENERLRAYLRFRSIEECASMERMRRLWTAEPDAPDDVRRASDSWAEYLRASRTFLADAAVTGWAIEKARKHAEAMAIATQHEIFINFVPFQAYPFVTGRCNLIGMDANTKHPYVLVRVPKDLTGHVRGTYRWPYYIMDAEAVYSPDTHT